MTAANGLPTGGNSLAAQAPGIAAWVGVGTVAVEEGAVELGTPVVDAGIDAATVELVEILDDAVEAVLPGAAVNVAALLHPDASTAAVNAVVSARFIPLLCFLWFCSFRGEEPAVATM